MIKEPLLINYEGDGDLTRNEMIACCCITLTAVASGILLFIFFG